MIDKAQKAAIAIFLRTIVFAMACFAFCSSSLHAGEVDPSSANPAKDSTTDFIQQIDGLEKTLVEANTVTVVEAQKQNSAILQAAREASQKEITDKPGFMPSYPDSRPTSNAWASVIPTKETGRVGEQLGADVGANNNSEGNGLTNKPSTSTLSLSDMGNAKTINKTLAGLEANRKSLDQSMPKLSGVMAGAKPPAPDKKAPEKKEDSGSQIDPNNASGRTQFGDRGELTLNNIARNNKKSGGDDDVKDMLDKALANKDKNKEKEEEKKKEEQAKLEKKLDELVKKDPFKFEDYESLRDLYNEKGVAAEELLTNNPKFKDLKDKILSDFAPRDASPSAKKERLINFLSNNQGGEKFQSPIIVADPNAPRHLEQPGHLDSL